VVSSGVVPAVPRPCEPRLRFKNVRQAETEAAHAPHLFGRKRYVMRPFALEITAGDFAFAAGHDLPTLRFAVVPRRTDAAGGFFLISIRCSF
jgi:hypothetical protein